MYSFTGTTNSVDISEMQPETPDTILVSVEKHSINQVLAAS